MKKLLILLILSLVFLTGCSGLYNINNFILPNDTDFLALIGELDTPKKTCQYMVDNFGYENNSVALTPYQLFLIKKGDCDDFKNWAIYFPNWHGYETYQILIEFPPREGEDNEYHMIGVFKEGGYYNISENTLYVECLCESFKEIMNFNLYRGWISYTVYDYDMNIIESGYN